MAVKQFALPLDDDSKQTGDITFKKLAETDAPVEFRLTNVGSFGSGPQLNLITMKSGAVTSHIFTATISNGTASVTLSHAQMMVIYADAEDGDWDYVEADWTVGQEDTPGKSNLLGFQNSRTFNMYGWPPNK